MKLVYIGMTMRIIFTYIALLAFLGQSYAAESSKLKSRRDAAKPTSVVRPINKVISVSTPVKIKKNASVDPLSTEGLINAQKNEISELKKKSRGLYNNIDANHGLHNQIFL